MRAIIAGTRSIREVAQVRLAIKNSGWPIDEIISGDADGVDQIAKEIAAEDNIDLVVIPANWKKHNKAAGYKRNSKMAWYASLLQDHEDPKVHGCLIAVWDGKSKGTKHMIDLARQWKLPVYIHLVDKEPTTPSTGDWDTNDTTLRSPFIDSQHPTSPSPA